MQDRVDSEFYQGCGWDGGRLPEGKVFERTTGQVDSIGDVVLRS